jgi:metal iron transporter
MPHALFLGSSLASVDRLDMVPRPPKEPSALRRRFARKALPGFLRFGNKGKDTSEAYELEPTEPQTGHTLTGLNEEGVRPPVTRSASIGGAELRPGRATEVETEEEVKHLPAGSPQGRMSDDDEEDGRRDEFMAAMKRYEAKLGGFNRIRWVDLHLRHATVSDPFLPRVMLGISELIYPRWTRYSLS